MNKTITNNVIRFLGLLFIQVLILKRISIGWEGFFYVNVILFPLFILLLPFRTSRPAELLLAFLIGICVDAYYESLGIHASASVFTAFMRPFILSWLEPREGYNVNHSPTLERMKFPWFFRYASILLLIHLGFYFSVEAFNFINILDIFLKVVFTYILSMSFILMVMFIFNPTD